MFVKGLDQAEEYWRAHPDFDMILITEDGQIYLTEGVQDRFELSASFGNIKLHVIRADDEWQSGKRVTGRRKRNLTSALLFYKLVE